MSAQEFNNILMPTSEKNSMENKGTYLMGNFNINLMNYNSHNPASQFLESIGCNSFFPHINMPMCHSLRSKTFIDNTFHCNMNENAISGNMTTDISDYLAQFLITPTLGKIKMKPKKILTKNFKKFSHENFKNVLRQIDWTDTRNLQLSNVNHLFEKSFNKTNQSLDKYAPWITKGILTSIKKFITNSTRPEIEFIFNLKSITN